MRDKQRNKKYHICIGREEDTNILSYVDFARLFNVMLIFTELSTYFLTNGTTFTLRIVKDP